MCFFFWNLLKFQIRRLFLMSHDRCNSFVLSRYNFFFCFIFICWTAFSVVVAVACCQSSCFPFLFILFSSLFHRMECIVVPWKWCNETMQLIFHNFAIYRFMFHLNAVGVLLVWKNILQQKLERMICECRPQESMLPKSTITASTIFFFCCSASFFSWAFFSFNVHCSLLFSFAKS